MEEKREGLATPALTWAELVTIEYELREEGLVSRSINDSDLGAVERIADAIAEAMKNVSYRDAIAACACVLCFLVGDLLATAAENLGDEDGAGGDSVPQ